MIRHRLVVRHPSRAAILLLEEACRWTLPSFSTGDDRHTAEVDYINRAMADRFGLRTTVLRGLDHSDPAEGPVVRVHELEVHGPTGALPPGLRWCLREDLPTTACRDEAADITAWAGDPSAVTDGRDWTRPGWFDGVRAWLEDTLRAAGAGAPFEITQRRAWPSSCVLFVRCAGADFYLKAVPDSGRRECAVTAYLARHFPAAIAPVVAVEPERRWLLMESVHGPTLEQVASVSAWERAAAAYGRLQAASRSRVGDLHGLGCPARTLQRLAWEIDGLRDGDAGLSSAQRQRLQGSASELRHRCERLAAFGMLPSLDHGDLWPGNVIAGDAGCTFIDWEDAAIGHPFLGLAPLVVGLGLYQPGLCTAAVIDRVERTYVSAFKEPGRGDDQLIQAVRLARPLGLLDMAVRYRRQRPSIVAGHPWMRDLVSQTVGLALDELKGP